MSERKRQGQGRGVTEAAVEQAALEWLEGVGWQVAAGIELAPGGLNVEREDYRQVILTGRLRDALVRLNPDLPSEAIDDALRKLLRPEGLAADLLLRNRAVHRMLVDGVTVEYRDKTGEIRGAQARVLDFDRPESNDWLAVNQFTVTENDHTRRPDVVLFVNGLPLAVIELKNAADESATIRSAFGQLQTYQAEVPSLFAPNALLVVSDGTEARVGALGAGWEWFKPWRTLADEDGDEDEEPPPPGGEHRPGLQVVIEGLCRKRHFLDLVRDFIVFEDDGGGRVVKKMAGYHQFHAVRAAVGQTLRAAEMVHGAPAPAEAPAPSPAPTPAPVPAPTSARPGGSPGDRRVGVVWHTQGSGKSLTMAFYAGRIVREPAMQNPTVVVLTDRNDLDDQLFATFSRCRDLLRQPPDQADSRAHLRTLLAVESGGVVFTTIHKFLPDATGERSPDPALSPRRNIVVIADEAHRSQYDFIDGYARHMRDALPHASFIGFTGTPIELEDANTRAVFGDYISIYDIQRAVDDRATVPIYYESRLARLSLDEAERPHIDPDFEEATEGEEVERKEKLKSKWAQIEAVVGSEKRLELVARDIVEHFERRCEAMDGKGMIVCMSRRIAVDLYRALARLRPDWHSGRRHEGGRAGRHEGRDSGGRTGRHSGQRTSRPSDDDDGAGALKVVMTGSASDPADWQPHIRTKQRREALAHRFRDPEDPLRLVIVRDMWLTGFDAPSLHTMYVDKPMRGHGLMQAIARVNRVFGDKPGGLVVDYLGLAQELKQALAAYTESGGSGRTALDQDEAVAVMLEKYEVCCALFHGFDGGGGGSGSRSRSGSDSGSGSRSGPGTTGSGSGSGWSKRWAAGSSTERLGMLPPAQEHILAQPDGKERLLRAVRELSQAFALSVPHEAALRIRDDVAFFQAVRAALAKRAPGEARPEEELDHAVKQIISRAVSSEGVVDIFAEAGLRKPDLSILSDDFLAEVRGMPQRNLAVELLQKLLKGEIKTRGRRNVVQARSFAEMLENALRRYRNRAIEAAQVIEELVGLAKAMREAAARGEDLGLDEDELAFYDALEANESAVRELGDEILGKIARELVETVRRTVTIDWTLKESVRAQMRVLVRRILRRYGYPPDKQERATRTVLEQAELLSEGWATP